MPEYRDHKTGETIKISGSGDKSIQSSGKLLLKKRPATANPTKTD